MSVTTFPHRCYTVTTTIGSSDIDPDRAEPVALITVTPVDPLGGEDYTVVPQFSETGEYLGIRVPGRIPDGSVDYAADYLRIAENHAKVIAAHITEITDAVSSVAHHPSSRGLDEDALVTRIENTLVNTLGGSRSGAKTGQNGR